MVLYTFIVPRDKKEMEKSLMVHAGIWPRIQKRPFVKLDSAGIRLKIRQPKKINQHRTRRSPVAFILMRTHNVRNKNAASPENGRRARSSISGAVNARRQFDLNVRSHHFDFHPVGG